MNKFNKSFFNFNETLLFILTIIMIINALWYSSRQISQELELPTVRYKEAFIPKIVKETYRPIARNIRMTYEGFYDKTTTDASNLFRKFGIL